MVMTFSELLQKGGYNIRNVVLLRRVTSKNQTGIIE